MKSQNKRLHGQTLHSETYKQLHRDPKFGQELNAEISGAQLYQLVDKLKVVPNRSEYDGYPSEPLEDPTLYYLWGDERRAVRRIVETYPHFIGDCMFKQKNPLKKSWEDFMWELLVEEWQFSDHENKKND